MEEPHYRGANGRVDSLAVGWLFTNDVLFFNDTDLTWDGSHHIPVGIQSNAAVLGDVPTFASNRAAVAMGAAEMLAELEKDERLLIPRTKIARGLWNALRNEDMTGITLFNLQACGGAFRFMQGSNVTAYGSMAGLASEKDESGWRIAEDILKAAGMSDLLNNPMAKSMTRVVIYDTRLAAGIPRFYELIRCMYEDMLAYNEIDLPYILVFMGSRNIDADQYLGEVNEPVDGAVGEGIHIETNVTEWTAAHENGADPQSIAASIQDAQQPAQKAEAPVDSSSEQGVDLDQIAAQAQRAVDLTLSLAEVELDYTFGTLPALDGVIRALHEVKDTQGFDEDTLWGLASAFGAYLGETMLRSGYADAGFSWGPDDDGEPMLVRRSGMENALGINVSGTGEKTEGTRPVTKCYKCLLYGGQDNIPDYIEATGVAMGVQAASSIDLLSNLLKAVFGFDGSDEEYEDEEDEQERLEAEKRAKEAEAAAAEAKKREEEELKQKIRDLKKEIADIDRALSSSGKETDEARAARLAKEALDAFERTPKDEPAHYAELLQAELAYEKQQKRVAEAEEQVASLEAERDGLGLFAFGKKKKAETAVMDARARLADVRKQVESSAEKAAYDVARSACEKKQQAIDQAWDFKKKQLEGALDLANKENKKNRDALEAKKRSLEAELCRIDPEEKKKAEEARRAMGEDAFLGLEVLKILPEGEPVLTSWIMNHVSGIYTPQKCTKVMELLIEKGNVRKVPKVEGRYTGYLLVSRGDAGKGVARSSSSARSFSGSSSGYSRGYSNSATSSLTQEYEQLARKVAMVMPEGEPVLTSWIMSHVDGIETPQKCTKVMEVLIKKGRVVKVPKVEGRYTGYKLI